MNRLFSIALAGLFVFTIPMTTFGGGNDQCFLKIAGIPGESTAPFHVVEIDLVGFRTGLVQKVISSSGGGGGAGKVDFGPLKVFKYVDKASIPIFVACAVGKHLTKVTLSVVNNNAEVPFDYFVVVLTDVIVSSVNDSTETTDNQGNLLETVGFDFAKIEWTYRPTEPNGAPGTPVKGGFDVRLNKKL